MPEAIELSNGFVTVRLDADSGVFDLLDGDGDTVIASAAIGVLLTDGQALSTRGLGFRLVSRMEPSDDAIGRGRTATACVEISDGLRLGVTVTLYDSRPGVVIDCDLRNETPEPARVARFEVLQGARLNLTSPAETWRFYKHGWQSWSPTLVLECSGEDLSMATPVIAPGTQPGAKEGRFVSEMVKGIVAPEVRPAEC